MLSHLLALPLPPVQQLEDYNLTMRGLLGTFLYESILSLHINIANWCCCYRPNIQSHWLLPQEKTFHLDRNWWTVCPLYLRSPHRGPIQPSVHMHTGSWLSSIQVAPFRQTISAQVLLSAVSDHWGRIKDWWTLIILLAYQKKRSSNSSFQKDPVKKLK